MYGADADFSVDTFGLINRIMPIVFGLERFISGKADVYVNQQA